MPVLGPDPPLLALAWLWTPGLCLSWAGLRIAPPPSKLCYLFLKAATPNRPTETSALDWAKALAPGKALLGEHLSDQPVRAQTPPFPAAQRRTCLSGTGGKAPSGPEFPRLTQMGFLWTDRPTRTPAAPALPRCQLGPA